jgi:hypothetical protein
LIFLPTAASCYSIGPGTNRISSSSNDRSDPDASVARSFGASTCCRHSRPQFSASFLTSRFATRQRWTSSRRPPILASIWRANRVIPRCCSRPTDYRQVVYWKSINGASRVESGAAAERWTAKRHTKGALP